MEWVAIGAFCVGLALLGIGLVWGVTVVAHLVWLAPPTALPDQLGPWKVETEKNEITLEYRGRAPKNGRFVFAASSYVHHKPVGPIIDVASPAFNALNAFRHADGAVRENLLGNRERLERAATYLLGWRGHFTQIRHQGRKVVFETLRGSSSKERHRRLHHRHVASLLPTMVEYASLVAAAAWFAPYEVEARAGGSGGYRDRRQESLPGLTGKWFVEVPGEEEPLWLDATEIEERLAVARFTPLTRVREKERDKWKPLGDVEAYRGRPREREVPAAPSPLAALHRFAFGAPARTVLFIATFVAATFGVGTGATTKDIENGRRSVDWPTTTGTVAESFLEERHNDDGTYYVPVVRYDYEVDGKQHRCDRLRFGSSQDGSDEAVMKHYPVGKEVTVHYDPVHPQVATLTPGVSAELIGMAIFVYCTFGIALVLVLALGFARRRAARARRRFVTQM